MCGDDRVENKVSKNVNGGADEIIPLSFAQEYEIIEDEETRRRKGEAAVKFLYENSKMILD